MAACAPGVGPPAAANADFCATIHRDSTVTLAQQLALVESLMARRTGVSLLSVATASAATAADPAAVQALGGLLLQQGGIGTPVTATLFAVGSTLYCWLFLRARSIPLWMAWLGLVASVLLVVELPLQIAGLVHGVVTYFAWILMAVFEVTFAAWLIARGVRD
jgi:hypothetical protein